MHSSVAHLLLRVGVAFVFLYPPINALGDPQAWIGYFPLFVKGYVPDEVLLHAFGLVEVFVALWILSGWRIFLPSVAAMAMLFGIVIFNPSEFQILFRDLSIAAVALSLAVVSWRDERKLGLSGGAEA